MENASKALIIAGAILLAILLISLGIIIYNQAAGTMQNNGMSEIDTTSFNQKFTQYEGNKVKGSQVNTLLQAVVANNTNPENSERFVLIAKGDSKTSVSMSISMYSSKSVPVGITTRADTGKTYKVVCSYRNGLVDKITITSNS